jgi:hypothetical protein
VLEIDQVGDSNFKINIATSWNGERWFHDLINSTITLKQFRDFFHGNTTILIPLQIRYRSDACEKLELQFLQKFHVFLENTAHELENRTNEV